MGQLLTLIPDIFFSYTFETKQKVMTGFPEQNMSGPVPKELKTHFLTDYKSYLKESQPRHCEKLLVWVCWWLIFPLGLPA